MNDFFYRKVNNTMQHLQSFLIENNDTFLAIATIADNEFTKGWTKVMLRRTPVTPY